MYHQSLNVPRSARNGGNSASSHGRKAPSLDHPGRTHSTQSILTAMDRFVRSVNNMHETILVPSRLRDMQLEAGRVPPPHPIKSNDLHSFYGMLSEVKDELLWGPGSIGSGRLGMSASMTSSMKSNVLRAPSVLAQKKTESLGSAGSDQDTDSDSVSETLSDTTAVSDESRDSLEHGRHLASAFQHHLQGLHVILHQLADSADYLSTRYQQEIEPAQH